MSGNSLGERLHDGLPVAGYRQQKESAVQRVNEHKALEERTLRALDSMRGDESFDQRWLAIAYTHIEQGFMAANRAVFRPARVELTEDEDWRETAPRAVTPRVPRLPPDAVLRAPPDDDGG